MIFTMEGDAYRADDVLAIMRYEDEIYVWLRGIQEQRQYKFDSEAECLEVWMRAVEAWRIALGEQIPISAPG